MSAKLNAGELPPLLLEPCVRAALEEDLGQAGDITSRALIARNARARALLLVRQDGILAGLDAALLAFSLLDADMRMRANFRDGESLQSGSGILELEGNARAILAAERTALNFLAHLSGIASVTASAVAAIAGSKARLCCTRKTTPGLRMLEKYAVGMGGGDTHRFGLYDALLIKDNHLALRKTRGKGGDDIKAALDAARAGIGSVAGSLCGIEVEVDDLRQLEAALQAGAQRILLDNMSEDELHRAVQITAGRALLEASGGISLQRVKAVAETGVDFISLGALTNAAPALDFSLEMVALPASRR